MRDDSNTSLSDNCLKPALTTDINQYPYLLQLKQLENAFPALRAFLAKICNGKDDGRRLVEEHFDKHYGRRPGRCAVLEFGKTTIDATRTFTSTETLRKYLKPELEKDESKAPRRRLFILEDMEPSMVDALGDCLGVDPLVFSEQMNTWNFTDSRSIPHRALPSLHSARQSFTLRYYEVRTLLDSKVNTLRSQMTLAINRRKYENWRDVDTPSVAPDQRHGFVRRCASFWTSQSANELQSNTDSGWDAVILVDPGMGAAGALDEKVKAAWILQDPLQYDDRAALWKASDWEKPNVVKPTQHYSRPYHDGCPTLAPLLLHDATRKTKQDISIFHEQRDHSSPLDELMFYWTKVASPNLIEEVSKHSSNSAYYLLKYIAQHWTNQLELICCSVAQSEYFADDHQAIIDSHETADQWKRALSKVTETTRDINYMRRQMNHFERAMIANLERLNVQLGSPQVDKTLPRALEDAQRDFITLNERLRPFRERVDDLTGIANDLASLRAAFKSIQDGEFGLRLSLFAAIIFPLTLVASILSMGSDFLPGQRKFWIFWATSLPFVLLFVMLLTYGRKPERYMRRYFATKTQAKTAARNQGLTSLETGIHAE